MAVSLVIYRDAYDRRRQHEAKRSIVLATKLLHTHTTIHVVTSMKLFQQLTSSAKCHTVELGAGRAAYSRGAVTCANQVDAPVSSQPFHILSHEQGHTNSL